MKSFIKYTFSTIVGVLIASIIMVAGLVVVGTAMALSDDTALVEVKDDSVLRLRLSGEIVEKQDANAISGMLGISDMTQRQGLNDIVGAIEKAARNENIKGLYIEAGMLQADYATLQEIRKAVIEFRKSRKWVVAFADEYTQGAYYVCSAADKVLLNPQGMLDLHGISSKPMFLKDLLAKVGVKMTVVKVGKFKSATEQYTEEQMSEANREQTTRYISNIWNVVLQDISKSRRISIDSLNIFADEMTSLQGAGYLKQHRLIDKTLYQNEVEAYLNTLLKKDKDEKVEMVGCAALNRSTIESIVSDNKIAVYYCEGSIVQNQESGMVMGDAGIVSKKMVKDLDKIAKDDDIKAVVIRVNSGGGDAFASEEIWNSVVKLKARKPVVISMGGMAASGAYYLSAGASWIVAQPTTLTGSIGIFGCFPDMSNLMQQKLGIKYDNVKTNKHADFSILQTARPFNAEEEAYLQAYINRGYELFCKRVADGRKISIGQVKQIAEGRVWTGADALRIKLVDEIGGMPEALKKAATMAKIKDEDYETIAYPKAKTWMEQLTETAGTDDELDQQLRLTLGAFYEPFVLVRQLQHQSPVQARCEIVQIAN